VVAGNFLRLTRACRSRFHSAARRSHAPRHAAAAARDR
jgi:hypothetical protein